MSIGAGRKGICELSAANSIATVKSPPTAAMTARSSINVATSGTRSALDWVGCCDHDNGMGREYSWWITQKLTDVFYAPGKFAPMFSYERSVHYPDGHRNVIFAQRGIHTLPRLDPSWLGTPPRKKAV